MRRILGIFVVLLCTVCAPVFADETDTPESDDEETLLVEVDEDTTALTEINVTMQSLGWCADDDYTPPENVLFSQTNVNNPTEDVGNPGHQDERVAELCKQLKEVRNLQGELDANMDELEDNAKAMRENEQSLANRTLTAASTAATGLGMMTAASAYSEKKADEEAEQDMKAYLATFKCEYGRGQSVKSSEEEITLPGGNELVNYYQEYKALADNLKNTKKALGLRAGIESEIVYDKAESNLYKYSSVGKTDGAFTSLSRALTDSEGEDAAAWNAQKEETAKKLKTGAIAAGAGIIGGIAGDYLINKNAPKNRVDEILAKRREIKASYQNLSNTLIEECNKTINAHKESVRTMPAEWLTSAFMQQYKRDVEAAQPITTLQELTKSKFCR